MSGRSHDSIDAMVSVVSAMRHMIDRRMPTIEDYERILSVCKRLYLENTELRDALRDLERMASSWTGTPERNGPIVRARAALGRR